MIKNGKCRLDSASEKGDVAQRSVAPRKVLVFYLRSSSFGDTSRMYRTRNV